MAMMRGAPPEQSFRQMSPLEKDKSAMCNSPGQFSTTSRQQAAAQPEHSSQQLYGEIS